MAKKESVYMAVHMAVHIAVYVAVYNKDENKCKDAENGRWHRARLTFFLRAAPHRKLPMIRSFCAKPHQAKSDKIRLIIRGTQRHKTTAYCVQ